MAKKRYTVITKDDVHDDVDSDFAFSEDNFDMIIDELDIVNEYLHRGDRLSRQKRYVSENRDSINQRQRDWRQQNPERVQQYNDRRDKEVIRERARGWYQAHVEQERERQRIIREKRRAQKAADQQDAGTGTASKIKTGIGNVKKQNVAISTKLQLQDENG